MIRIAKLTSTRQTQRGILTADIERAVGRKTVESTTAGPERNPDVTIGRAVSGKTGSSK
jgi:hypothetical protein